MNHSPPFPAPAAPVAAPLVGVTVILPRPFHDPQEWRLEVPEAEPEDMAEHVFHLSNCPPDALSAADRELVAKYPCEGIRSVSVGDILLLDTRNPQGKRHVAIVKSFGFAFY